MLVVVVVVDVVVNIGLLEACTGRLPKVGRLVLVLVVVVVVGAAVVGVDCSSSCC